MVWQLEYGKDLDLLGRAAQTGEGIKEAGGMTARRRLIRVPASSANLGPGYDVMAAAVSLYLEVEVEETGEFSVDTGGLPVARLTATTSLVRASREPAAGRWLLSPAPSTARYRRRAGSARARRRSSPAWSPPTTSSSWRSPGEELLARAAEIEGHPDDVAAAISAASSSAARRRGRRPIAARFDPRTASRRSS